MSNANKAIINVMKTATHQAVMQLKGKSIPNMSLINDILAFRMVIVESGVNFAIAPSALPVEEAGPGNFLVKIYATIIGDDVVGPTGCILSAMPISPLLELDFQLYAENQQELTDGILELISDEVENILCQILDGGETSTTHFY